MPSFWRNILGGSSSSSGNGGSSSSKSRGIGSSSNNSSNSTLDASLPSASASASASKHPGPSGSLTPGSRKQRVASTGSFAPTPDASGVDGGARNAQDAATTASPAGSSRRPPSQQSLGTARQDVPSPRNGAGPSATQAIGIPLAPSTSNTASSAGPSSYGVTSSAASNSGMTDDDEDTDSIPQTPFSAGHSPSHARHKFPSQPKQSLASSADDPDDLEALDDAAGNSSNAGAISPSGTARNPRHTGSVSSVSSTLSKTSISTPQQDGKPSIPTTHTILANPLPQPSSGLAAAISSVLPSSSSSNGLSNGKAAASGEGPRTFDIDDMISRLLDAGYSGKLTKSICLKNSEITAICSAAREVFLSQPTLIELSPSVKIVGDVHGQYHDLIRLFEMCGFPPKSNYLFLGDYVDRGKQSLETILLLLCYKVKYPENFFLLRGNHECANVTRVYGFYDECKRRCSIKTWKTFVDVFNCLPITAIVAGKIFCVHGGLSPSLSAMDDIRRISRPTDVPDYGLLNDLLWSDPSDTALDWEDNERGVSYCFGKAVIQDFLAKYDFDLICRAHMVVEDGYEFWNERTLVTIFSAPNYCGEFDNFAAVMSVSEDLLCAFELLKPLDGPALKKELLKSKRKNSAALATTSTS